MRSVSRMNAWCWTLVFCLGCGQSVAQNTVETPVPAAPAQTTVAVVEETAKTDAGATSTKPLVPEEDLKPYAAGKSMRVGEDWPRFLGPRETGISGETGLIAPWPKAGLPIVWEKTVGTGYSAPSVRGDKIVLHHRKRKTSIIDCFSAETGEPRWDYSYPTDFEDPYGYNNGPRCSPLLTQDRCYTFGAEGKLLCLNLETGKKIWERDTGSDWKVPEAFFGVGSTPILVDGKLIVMVGGAPKSGVVAFDSETGKTLWENVSKELHTPPDDNFMMDDKLASYSSMIAADIHGHRHVFALMRDGLVSLDPQTGKVRFSYFFRSRSFESVNAARPVVVGDRVLLSAAYRTGAALLQIKPSGSEFAELWMTPELQTHWSTTIAHNGFFYGFSGRHENEARLVCLDAKTGKVAWQTEGPPPDGEPAEDASAAYYGRGSAVLADGNFIVLGERGLLALVEANATRFKEISRFKLPRMTYPCWAAPVLSRKRLYLRCEDYLVCLDLAPPVQE